MFNAEDYEDFRIKYNKYTIKFILDSLNSYIISRYIDDFHSINIPLLKPSISKLEQALNHLKKADKLRQEHSSNAYVYHCYDNSIFDTLTITISFSYEEIITLLHYLHHIKFQDTYDFTKLNEITKELETYIGSHKAWLDFRKISANPNSE